jgi:alternate signal-mediated exported protein
MNKFTKGAIATGAGIVLLLGGAGTFALWNDTEVISAGSVSSGTLTIDTPGTAVWTDVSPDRASATIVPSAAFRAVPGDVIKFSQNFVVHATGKNLVANLTVNTTDIAAGGWSTYVSSSTSIKVNGTAATQITSADDGKTVTVEVTLTFSPTAPNTTQNQTVDLSALLVTATQYRP